MRTQSVGAISVIARIHALRLRYVNRSYAVKTANYVGKRWAWSATSPYCWWRHTVTERDGQETLRIISARKVDKTERRIYEQGQ